MGCLAAEMDGGRPNPNFYRDNIWHLGISFFLVYTAFSGIQNVSTSLITGNVGHVAPAVLYIIFTISCLFGPAFEFRVGNIRSLFLGFTSIVFFAVAYIIASNYDDKEALKWIVLCLGAAALGAMASPIWVAQGTYITEQANGWASALGEDSKMATATGIFFLCFQATQVSGNLIESVVMNATNNNSNLVFIIYLVFALAGTACVKTLRVAPEKLPSGEPQPVMDTVAGVLQQWQDPKLAYLIPIIMFSGLEMGWIWGDFTANFVKPALGKGNVGYVMACFGSADALFSLAFGKLSDSIGGIGGRMSVLTLGTVAQLAIIILARFSLGNAESLTWGTLIFIAIVWAVGDAAWNTQLSAIINESFDPPASAIANFKLFQSFMTAVAFFYQDALSAHVKLDIMLVFIAAGFTGLLLLWNKRKTEENTHAKEPLLGPA